MTFSWTLSIKLANEMEESFDIEDFVYFLSMYILGTEAHNLSNF